MDVEQFIESVKGIVITVGGKHEISELQAIAIFIALDKNNK